MFEDMKKPGTSKYKAIQALKNAGVSLDKLFERVEKGRETEAENRTKKQQEYKEKILANLDD
ncbi:MAG: hypothetical protein NY202_04245 [Mollicutes bacterium UO1]